MNRIHRRACLILVAVALIVPAGFAPGCGYHLQGRGSFLPLRIKSIGIPAFQSAIAKREVVEKITDAVTKEFLSRGGYKIQPSRDGVDAVLDGTIIGFAQTPIAFDADGRANRALLTITAGVVMRDLVESKTLYESPAFQFRSEIELSRGGSDFFDPESEGIDQISREFARSLVATIVEGF